MPDIRVNPLLTALSERADSCVPALADGTRSLTYGELQQQIRRWQSWLTAIPYQRIGLLADNGIDWILMDLAAMAAGKCLIPVPTFFSDQQVINLLTRSSCDCLFYQTQVIHPNAVRAIKGLGFSEPEPTEIAAQQAPLSAHLNCLIRADAPAPEGWKQACQKVTFTSGTSGDPKGVCLSVEQQLAVAQSLLSEVRQAGVTRHLCQLPLSVLLENIAGVYVPLLQGAEVVVPQLSELGFDGASAMNIATWQQALLEWQPESLLLTPALLKLMVGLTLKSPDTLPRFKYLALGGGATSAELVTQARTLDLPVYEGYGLSESASVVALNPFAAAKPGAVGKPLPHLKVTLAEDGEIMVAGNTMLGYLGEATPLSTVSEAAAFATGDLGYIDDEGYLHISGRKKDTIITGFGRNISPAWLEAQMMAAQGVHQVWVYGDEQRPLTAAIFAPELSDGAISQQLQALNSSLPNYAQLVYWRRFTQPVTAASQLATAQGRLRRRQLYDLLTDPEQAYLGECHELSSDLVVSNC